MYNTSIGKVAWLAERMLYGNCAQHRRLPYARVLPGALAQNTGTACAVVWAGGCVGSGQNPSEKVLGAYQ